MGEMNWLDQTSGEVSSAEIIYRGDSRGNLSVIGHRDIRPGRNVDLGIHL